LTPITIKRTHRASGVARNSSQGCVTSIVFNLQPTPFIIFVGSGTFDSRTRHHILNGNLTEVAEMHHGEHNGIRRRQIADGSTHSFNLLDEELSTFVGVVL